MSPARPSLDIVHHRLANGLRVNLHADASLPLVAINLWYHVGSKNERPGRTGLAHLFEHMLFQGSENVGPNEHFRLVQQAGGVANASTWYDRTNYYETLPAHYLELGLWLEAERMGRLLGGLDEEKLRTQREVVLNERRQRVDNQPYGAALERLHEVLYPPGHPYRWPVIGTLEDIAAVTLEDVRDFFRTYYAPNNAVLTLAGDFEPEAALDLVRRHFEVFEPAPPPPAVVLPEDDGGGHRLQVVEDAVSLPRLYLAGRVPPYGDRRWYAADLLAILLAAGKSSRLYEDLVYRKQVAQEVGCHLYPAELESTFLVVATARPPATIETLEREIGAHLDRLGEEPPRAEEVEMARNKVLTALFDDLQTLDRRADLISQFTTLFGDPHALGREIDAVTGLTPGDLKAVAAQHLGAARRVAVVVVPREARP